MSTKRLARTVIEGGRRRYNTFERRYSHRRQRVHVRAWLAAVRCDPEVAEARAAPGMEPVYKDFFDKLAPAERWLCARVGRPWREVEGEILATFDTRSLPGRHIVFDHLLPSRWQTPREGWRVHKRVWFWVDAQGRLRARSPVWGKRHRRAEVPGCRCARAFVGERRVGRRGARLYWLEPTGATPEERYRQGVELSAAERAAWEALCEAGRREVMRELPER